MLLDPRHADGPVVSVLDGDGARLALAEGRSAFPRRLRGRIGERGGPRALASGSGREEASR